ncbi:MAG TPA: arginine--tRNA ligase [Candidatus Limiplasma sp.]|nr:arginine--tRNA ligase [Candidatus Limiplasma sp.]HPS80778.1 arginine--tRNA ligase [Candidatus Limiplasma sp.]
MNDMRTTLSMLIENAILTSFEGIEGLPTAGDIAGFLEVPPEKEMGDFAFPCFKLSKALRKGPPQIAQALAAAIDAPEVCEAKPLGGYLNFFFKREQFAQKTVRQVLDAPGQYGASRQGAGKTVCIDYSSINIAKRFHIGHLSTTMIGHSLQRIYNHLGYRTVGINHLGDWGTQFGKLISAYKRWGNREEVEKDGVEALTRLYVKFHEEADAEEKATGAHTLEDEGRAYFKAIEDGGAEALQLFNWFKELTLRDCARVYELLGVTFDSYAGESFYNDKMGRVLDELREKNLLTLSDGASIVDLTDDDMPPCLILKKDGATLYATRDIAAALYRADTYHFDKCLYVVAYQQDLHFRQWFKVVEKMGYPWAKDLVHVAFGMISYEGQTLSTRKGYVVYLEDLLRRAQEKALAIIEEKSPNLPNKEAVARQVGIGAVVYADLQNNRIKDIDFWWDRALNFDGETGPYVQYTHARCCSVLRKAEEQGVTLVEPDYSGLADDFAQDLLRIISRFPEAVADAADKYEPSMVTRATTEVAKAYNKFYYENRILDAEPAVREARLQLTRAAQDVLRTGMYLIGMEAPERM